MEVLRAIHLYGLNKRSRKHDKNVSVSHFFPYISRAALRLPRHRNNTNLPSFNDLENIFKVIHNFIDNEIMPFMISGRC